MVENINNENLLKKFFKLLLRGTFIDIIARISDYTFMFASVPIVGSITVTLLSFIKQDLFSKEISLIALFFIFLFLLVGYFLNRGKPQSGAPRKLSYDDWAVEIFLKSAKYIFYFLYSASLTSIILSYFEKPFGEEINRQITELLPDVMQFYFFLLFIVLPIFALIVSFGVVLSLKTSVDKTTGIKRILLFALINLPILGFGLFLETFDLTSIDIEKASRIASLLVGPLLIYIIRVLFFRKWINLESVK